MYFTNVSVHAVGMLRPLGEFIGVKWIGGLELGNNLRVLIEEDLKAVQRFLRQLTIARWKSMSE